MEISLLLGTQIAAMLLMVLIGFVSVRCGLFKAEDSRIISTLTLYVICPCMIIDAFQIEATPEAKSGLILAFCAGGLSQILGLVLDAVLRRPLHLDPVERTSAIYTNSANLVIPVVGYVLGPEWVLYTCGYMITQTVLFWTHCISVIRGGGKIEIKKIILNLNVLSIAVGLALFLSGAKLPEIPSITMHSIGIMVGPMSMIVAGMLIGGMPLGRLKAYRRLPFIVFLRLIAYPLVTLAVFACSGMAGLMPQGDRVLMVTFLAACAPCASTVVQMANLYERNGEYASLINAVSTVLCVVTMPLLIWLYQAVV